MQMQNSKLERLIQWVLMKHTRQLDKADVPYFLHLMRVALPFWKEPELFLTALAHDLLEDTNTTFHEMLEMGFPSSVAERVSVLTRNKGEEYGTYISRIIGCNDLAVARIKISDSLDNLRRAYTLPTDQRNYFITKYTDVITKLNVAFPELKHYV